MKIASSRLPLIRKRKRKIKSIPNKVVIHIHNMTNIDSNDDGNISNNNNCNSHNNNSNSYNTSDNNDNNISFTLNTNDDNDTGDSSVNILDLEDLIESSKKHNEKELPFENFIKERNRFDVKLEEHIKNERKVVDVNVPKNTILGGSIFKAEQVVEGRLGLSEEQANKRRNNFKRKMVENEARNMKSTKSSKKTSQNGLNSDILFSVSEAIQLLAKDLKKRAREESERQGRQGGQGTRGGRGR